MSSVMAGCHHPQTILKHIFLPRVRVQIDFLFLSHNYDSFFLKRCTQFSRYESLFFSFHTAEYCLYFNKCTISSNKCCIMGIQGFSRKKWCYKMFIKQFHKRCFTEVNTSLLLRSIVKKCQMLLKSISSPRCSLTDSKHSKHFV